MKNNHLLKGTTLLCFLLGSSVVANADVTLELDAITVESSTIDDKFESNKTEVSNTVVITGDKVEDHHAENIGNVLNTIPGVTIRVNEGDSNKIHIRGIAGEVYMGEKPGVAIVIDGVPVQERAGSVNIDSDNIESIKVIKGGASYLYGNDALAGAVIITTKRPKGKNEGFVVTEQGSYGYEKYLGRYMGSTDNFAIELQGSYKASEGYWDNSDYWAKSMNGKVQYYIDDSSDITLGVDMSTRYENDSGSITAVVDGVDQIETNPTSVGEVGYAVDYDIDLTKLFVTYAKNFSNSNLMTQIYRYEDTTTNKSGAYDAIPGNGLLRDGHRSESYANTVQSGLKSEYRIDLQRVATMIGIDVANNEEEKNSKYIVDYTSRGTTYPAGTVTSDTDFTEEVRALYGEAKYGITDKLIGSVNARYDYMAYDYTNKKTATAWDKDFNEGSYRLGATYKIDPDNIVYASGSTGFRVPTVAQLFAGDILSSGRQAYTNNQNIDTEMTYNYELGYRGKTALLEYEVSVYQLDRKDVITRNGGNYVSHPDDTTFPVQYGNFADIQNRGLELSVNSDRKKRLSLGLAYTFLSSKYTRQDTYHLILYDTVNSVDYVEGTYDLAGNYVPRTSKHTINLTVDYKVLPNWSLTAEVNYRSSQYADELNRVKVSGYEVVNLRTKYNFTLMGNSLELFGKIDNVLDNQYYMMPRVTGDRNDDGFYNAGDMGLTVNPGSIFTAGLSMRF